MIDSATLIGVVAIVGGVALICREPCLPTLIRKALEQARQIGELEERVRWLEAEDDEPDPAREDDEDDPPLKVVAIGKRA